jgi:hypothetical protein
MFISHSLYDNLTLLGHYREENIQQAWASLVFKRPFFFRAVWSATQSCNCRVLAKKHCWCIDELHQRLKEGLITFYWVLGESLTTELLQLGQNAMLEVLTTVKEPLLELSPELGPLDLQVVLLLVAIQGITKAQPFESHRECFNSLLKGLPLTPEFYRAALTLAARMGLIESNTIAVKGFTQVFKAKAF